VLHPQVAPPSAPPHVARIETGRTLYMNANGGRNQSRNGELNPRSSHSQNERR